MLFYLINKNARLTELNKYKMLIGYKMLIYVIIGIAIKIIRQLLLFNIALIRSVLPKVRRQ